MQKQEKQSLREGRAHGTSLFPCAYYLALGNSVRLRVKHHWHEELEIIYLKSGKFKVSVDTEYYEVEQECFFFINSGQLHDIHSLTQDFEEQAIVFDPQMLRFQNYNSIDEYILQPLVQGTLTFPRFLTVTHPVFPFFRSEYRRISQAFCQDQQITGKGEQIYTNDMTAQMQINASLLQLLALLLDQELMCRTLKPENQRIESVKTVLTHISLECGFNNMGNFQRLFKRKTGTTPLQYRKNCLSKKSK